MGNKVIIGSVTLLLVIFILFICFIWLCRKYKKLCWAEEFANPASPNSNVSILIEVVLIVLSTLLFLSQTRTMELNEPSSRNTTVLSSGSTRGNVSSTLAAGSSEEDKDLPPSYESLFPDR